MIYNGLQWCNHSYEYFPVWGFINYMYMNTEQCCGNSQSCRTLSDKSCECPVNLKTELEIQYLTLLSLHTMIGATL